MISTENMTITLNLIRQIVPGSRSKVSVKKLKAKQNKLKFEDTIKVQMFTCHKILNPNHLSSEFVISPLSQLFTVEWAFRKHNAKFWASYSL